MLRKKDRTLDLYLRVGAELRLLGALNDRVVDDLCLLLYAKDWNRCQSRGWYDMACSRAENNMFRDFPDLPPEYIHYLVTVEFGTERWRDVDRWMGDNWRRWSHWSYDEDEHVAAWAPIPDVYEGE